METVDVTKLSREELEETVISQSKQLQLLSKQVEQKNNKLAVLEGHVEYLGDKLLQIRELTK